MNLPRPKRLSLAETHWRHQLRSAYRSVQALAEALDLLPHQWPARVNAEFPLLVPHAFVQRMQRGYSGDPLLLQVWPDQQETELTEGYLTDPVGDQASRKSRGVLHKYQGRALLITTGACAVHCRYCFRQHFPYASEHVAGAHRAEALHYIAADPSIEEVILSGGDPLMLATDALGGLTDDLARIEHVKRLRIHTRLPIVLPERITDDLLAWLDQLPWPVVMVIHANHAHEFDASVDQALRHLDAVGVHLLNQAVLLKGVNDDVEALVNLMERAFEAGVLPYYLHQLDKVKGAQRFAVDDETAVDLMEQLRTRLSGYLVPRFVTEQSGAPYKVPLI